MGDDSHQDHALRGLMDEGSAATTRQMTLEEIRAVVATAHDYGFQSFAAHAHGAEAIRPPVIGGVDRFEHGTFMMPRI